MYNITKADMIAIGRHLVITYPFSKCTQINTFAVVDEQDDLNTTNLGATYDDYLAGSFWARKWVLQGALPDKLCKQYPLLIMEQKTKVKKHLFDMESCMDFYLIVIDVPDCPECPDDCKRTDTQVKCDLSDMVETVIAQLKKYHLWEITPADGEKKNVWVPKGQIDYWQQEGEITAARRLVDLEQFIMGKNVNIYPTELHTSDGAIGIAFHFQLCSCNEVQTEFNYNNAKPKNLAGTKCNIC